MCRLMYFPGSVCIVVQSFAYIYDNHLYMGPAIPEFGFSVIYAVGWMQNLRITCELE